MTPWHFRSPLVSLRGVTQPALSLEDRISGAAPWTTSLASAACIPVDPDLACAGVEKSGHADSTRSCVKALQIETAATLPGRFSPSGREPLEIRRAHQEESRAP